MNWRILITVFLLLVLFGCADTYQKTVQVEAKMIAVDEDHISSIKDFTEYKGKYTDDIEVTFKYNLGKYEFVDNYTIPYTTGLDVFRNEGKVKLTIIAKRDGMASCYLKVFLGKKQINPQTSSVSGGMDQLFIYINEMEKMPGVTGDALPVSWKASASTSKPEQKLNDIDNSISAKEASPKRIGGID